MHRTDTPLAAARSLNVRTLVAQTGVSRDGKIFSNTGLSPNCELLPRPGTLVAWTAQGFPPGLPYKGPTGKDFVPFGVGLVQLDDVIRVEGRLTENDPAKLQFGMDVELTMVPLTTDDEGNEIVT